MPDYDVAVIGGGLGGYVGAIRAAQLGLRAVLVEKDNVGGVCLNWGCIPSKALLHAADLIHAIAGASAFGVTAGAVSLDFGVSVDRSREVVAKMVGGVETLLAQNGVTLIRDEAKLTGPNSLSISSTGETLTADNVVIATGGHARSLPSLPVDGDRVITSREALALRTAPASVVIVGGGAIGVEFAYLWRAYGSQVTVVEALPHLLPNEDEDVSRQLERSFAAQGIEVLTDARVEAASVDADGVTVSIASAGGARDLRADRVLVAVGFGGNSAGLGLEEVGVQVEGGFVKVDAYCRTSVPGVWAVGDVTGQLLLAHVAAHQGTTVAEAIAGGTPPALDYTKMPRAVYCQPQVASIGLTEAQARAQGMAVRVGRFPLRANGKASAAGQTEGFVKVVVDTETDGIAGCHVVGHDASELISQVSVAMLLEATSSDLGFAVQVHPTVAEAIKEAALAAHGQAIHFWSK